MESVGGRNRSKLHAAAHHPTRLIDLQRNWVTMRQNVAPYPLYRVRERCNLVPLWLAVWQEA